MDDDLQQTSPEPPPTMPPPPGAPPPEVRGLSTTGPPGRARPMGPRARGRIRLGALFMMIGGGIVLLSIFLPRFTVIGPGGTSSLSGIEGAGIGMLLLGVLAVVKGLEGLRPGTLPMRFGSPILTGIFMVILLAVRWSDLQNGMNAASGLPGVSASIGTGYWLSVFGAVIVLCGGSLLQFSDRVG